MARFRVKIRFKDKNGYTRVFDTFIDADYQTDVIPIAETLYGKGCVLNFTRA